MTCGRREAWRKSKRLGAYGGRGPSHSEGFADQPAVYPKAVGSLVRCGVVAVVLALVMGAVLTAQGCAVSDATAERLRERAAAADRVVVMWAEPVDAKGQPLPPVEAERWRDAALHRLRRGYHEAALDVLEEWPEDPVLRRELEALGDGRAGELKPGSGRAP